MIDTSSFSTPDLQSLINPLPMPKIPNPADWMYERVVRSIIDFEKGLDADKEVGARLVSFGLSETIHIDDVGHWGPDMIIFHGVNVDGNKVQLLQHISQLSVLLVAVKPVDEPRRIGYILEKRLNGDQQQDE